MNRLKKRYASTKEQRAEEKEKCKKLTTVK